MIHLRDGTIVPVDKSELTGEIARRYKFKKVEIL